MSTVCDCPLILNVMAAMARNPNRLEQLGGAAFEGAEPVFELDAGSFEVLGRGLTRHLERLADGNGNRGKWLRYLRPIPAVGGPVRGRLDMERKNRLAGGLGQP